MAAYTQNYNLIKPATTDNYSVKDFNDNADLIDAELAKLHGSFSVITMSALAWSDSQYSFETDYPVASYDLEIALDSTATSAQVEAFISAQMVGSATSNVVKAYGTVPTVDIPVILKVVKK